MKKTIAILSLACAAVAAAAPMASQNWVSNRIEQAQFETEARTDMKLQDSLAIMQRALDILGEASPDLTNEVQYVSRAGSNDCYVVSSYADTNFVGRIVAWDRESSHPRRYVNSALGFEIFRYDGWEDVTVRTNTYSSSAVSLVSTPSSYVVEVTNTVPVTEYTSTPIWVPESVEYREYPYVVSNQTVYITNAVTIPAYISGYDTVLVTNSWVTQVNAYTNLVFDYSYVTNTYSFTREYATTNVYTKVWGELGGAEFPQQSQYLNWRLVSPQGYIMEIYGYRCNDAEWYRAVYGEE